MENVNVFHSCDVREKGEGSQPQGSIRPATDLGREGPGQRQFQMTTRLQTASFIVVREERLWLADLIRALIDARISMITLQYQDRERAKRDIGVTYAQHHYVPVDTTRGISASRIR